MAHAEIHGAQGQALSGGDRLGFFEQLANNDTVAREISNAGFTEVKVTGKGRAREAKALWPLDDATAETPARIRKIVELPEGQEIA